MATPVAWDTETFLIQPGEAAPPPVCMQWAGADRGARLMHAELDRAVDVFEGWLDSPDVYLIGQSVAYDFAVMAARWPHLLPKIFDVYAADRVTDTALRGKLIDIASGVAATDDKGDGYVTIAGERTKVRYSLDQLVQRYAAEYAPYVDKSDPWRTKYGTLADVPVDQWPDEAKRYALNDGTFTIAVWQGQEHYAPWLDDQHRQARAAWAIHLMGAWGLATRPGAADALLVQLNADIAADRALLTQAGLVRADGTKDTAAAKDRVVKICAGLGIEWKRTDGDGVSLDADATEQTRDPLLQAYSRYASASTLRSRVKRARSPVIQSRWKPIGAATGRISCATGDPPKKAGAFPAMDGMQLMNLPRSGGLRDVFGPRDGYTYIAIDYSAAELSAWAQACIWTVGFSDMAIAINAGKDCHSVMGANVIGRDYDTFRSMLRGDAGADLKTEAKNARGFAKVPNFSAPTGVAARTLVDIARAQWGLEIDEAKAQDMIDTWAATWGEAKPYLKWVGKQIGPDRTGTFVQFGSNRVRSGLRYTVLANTPFQGLIADLIKAALWRASRECYVTPESPLYGSRIVSCIHDEILAETPYGPGLEARADAAARRLSWIMEDEAKKWIPDVRLAAPPMLAGVWTKAAEEVTNTDGMLVPWYPDGWLRCA